LTRQLVSLWQSRGLRRVGFYEFDREQGLEHDLIDPNNLNQRVDLIVRDDALGMSPLPPLANDSSCC
jgi:hypothetical protein